MIHAISRSMLIGMSLLALLACVNINPSGSPQTRYYLLRPMPLSSTSTPPAGLRNQSLAVGPVSVATYLKRPQLVTRLTANEIHADEFAHWAEPLSDGIARVIQENLCALTSANRVGTYATRLSATADLQISVDLLRFEADSAGDVTLRAAWRIIQPAAQQVLIEERSTCVQASVGEDPPAVVETMSIALATLTRLIAEALVEIAQQP